MSCEYLAPGSPKCTCDACLMTAPVHVALQLRDALAHERDRAKRVVRVFWRVRDVGTIGKGWEIETRREMRKARHVLANDGGDPVRIYRVTVRRKSK